MYRHFVILLILLTRVICSPYALYVCSAEANRDVNTPTFELNLEPTHPTAWLGWRPEYKDNVSFIATLKGTTASNESVQFASATFTFHLGTPSQWEGVCMNYDGDTDIGTSYDLFICRDDNPGGSGQTHTVTHPIVVPGENVNVSGQPVEIGLGLTITGIGSGINIPKDDNGDYIADSWETGAWVDGRHSPPADEETGPNAGTSVEANTQVGDGLVVFEEYRGFEIAGSHTRLSPTQKDVK